LQALRWPQQHLLLQLPERVSDLGDASDAIGVVAMAMPTMGLAGNRRPTDLEKAILENWAVSELCLEKSA